jgi:hypothetical protein
MKELSSPVKFSEVKNLIFNQEYKGSLSALGLDQFETVWHYPYGETIKDIEERSVIRIRIQSNDSTRYVYLKRHNAKYIGLRRLFYPQSKHDVSEGRTEFRNICDFREHGLPTVVPVVAGQKFIRFFWVVSFLITEDFSPFVSLETLIREKPEFFMGEDGKSRKRILFEQISHLARKMHENGFNHRDFNATHILVYYQKTSDIPKIALFDLQRVDRGRFFRFRWKIKSLARLIYSLPDDLFDLDDRMNLLRFYKGRYELHFLDRFEWFWIRRKTARIRRHTQKIMARREERKREFFSAK